MFNEHFCRYLFVLDWIKYSFFLQQPLSTVRFFSKIDVSSYILYERDAKKFSDQILQCSFKTSQGIIEHMDYATYADDPFRNLLRQLLLVEGFRVEIHEMKTVSGLLLH